MKQLFLLITCLICLQTLRAAPGFAYHGSLQEANGSAFNLSAWQKRPAAERTFIFSLYNLAADGEPLWTATFSGEAGQVTPDANGVFTAELADGLTSDGTTKSFFTVLSEHDDASLYLGITIGEGTKELTPRQQILAVPYAAVAEYAEGNAHDFTAESAITAKELAVNDDLTLETLSVSGLTEMIDTFETEAVETTTLTVTEEVTFMDEVTAETIEGEWALPIGGIVPFFGADEDIPEGWALCDGNNGTPNLNDCFIMGADEQTYPQESTGGVSSVTLEVKHLPEHTHSYTRKIYASLYNFWGEERDDGWDRWSRRVSHTRTTSDGDGLSATPTPITILPPYVYVRYIMRIR